MSTKLTLKMIDDMVEFARSSNIKPIKFLWKEFYIIFVHDLTPPRSLLRTLTESGIRAFLFRLKYGIDLIDPPL